MRCIHASTVEAIRSHIIIVVDSWNFRRAVELPGLFLGQRRGGELAHRLHIVRGLDAWQLSGSGVASATACASRTATCHRAG